MPSTLLECFELLVDAEQLAPRLAAAAAALAQLPDLADEKGWLAAACARVEGVRGATQGDLLTRALRLSALESLKNGERGKLLQGAIADEVDRLQAGITLAGTARSPLLDALFHNLKMPPLRKCSRAELVRCCSELERRLASSYARRILTTERYLPVERIVQSLGVALSTWSSVFIDPPLEGDAEAGVADELTAAAAAVELAVRQARHLAHAALLPAAELLDAAGVITTPKAKRRGKDIDEDTHPMLEQDPRDPHLPTAEEQAELASAAASD